MSYSTAEDVRLIIHTALTNTEIESIIAMSDAQIDKELGTMSVSDALIKKLSILLSAMTIKGRQPKSSAAGEYKEDSGEIMEIWIAEIKLIKTLYKLVQIASSDYQAINEDKRYTQQ